MTRVNIPLADGIRVAVELHGCDIALATEQSLALMAELTNLPEAEREEACQRLLPRYPELQKLSTLIATLGGGDAVN